MKPAQKKYRAIIFDFGGVISRDGNFRKFSQQLARDHGVARDVLWEVMIDAWLAARVDRRHDRAFWQRVSKTLGISASHFRNDVRRSTKMRPGMIAFIARLKKHYRIALLSNHIAGWLEWMLDAHDLRKLFDVIVPSYDTGLRKPDPAIYRLALKKLSVRAAECIFIDDLEPNISPASELGITAILFEGQRALEQKLRQLKVLPSPRSTR